jgi:curved DNA-binding protein CbpA
MAEPLPPDPYKALGVPKDAGIPEIRSAHRKLVLKCHPDKVQDAALKAVKQDEFQAVQQAYEILADDRRRKEYDERVKLAELRKEMMGQRGLPTRPVARPVPAYYAENVVYSAAPTRKPESYEESFYETRRSPSGLRHYSSQDEKARDRKAREEAERARELKERERREKERAIDKARRKKERDKEEKDRDKEEKNKGKYRSAYVEDDDSDDYSRRSSARKQPRSEKSYKISRPPSPPSPPPPPSFARAATYNAYADSPYIVRQKPEEPPTREDDDDSDSYVPLSTKEKEIEGEIKHRNEWMQSVFALKSADAPPVESQDPKETVDTSKDAETEKKPAKVMLTSVPPTQLGIKVMNPETTDPSIDIIAVHGLGAIPEFTWKAKGTGVNWLSDSRMLPPAVPEARIMIFGYDSLWLGKTPVRTRLGIIADKLLLHLGKERDVSMATILG